MYIYLKSFTWINQKRNVSNSNVLLQFSQDLILCIRDYVSIIFSCIKHLVVNLDKSLVVVIVLLLNNVMPKLNLKIKIKKVIIKNTLITAINVQEN